MIAAPRKTGPRPTRAGALFRVRFGGGVWLAVLALALVLPAPSPRTVAAEELSSRKIRSLIFNRRMIRKEYEFRGRETVDTGRSVEECLVFRSTAGNRIYLLESGLAKRFFLPNGNYTLELRFVGYSRHGIPLARAAGRSALVRQNETPYEGDITEKDLRVKELREQLLRGRAAPNEIRLRYSGKRGDYLSFYDIDGEEIYYKYRDDRFDRRAEERVANLIPGQAYTVSGAFLGLLLKNRLVLRGNRSFRDDLQNADSIPAYEYKTATPLRLDQILY